MQINKEQIKDICIYIDCSHYNIGVYIFCNNKEFCSEIFLNSRNISFSRGIADVMKRLFESNDLKFKNVKRVVLGIGPGSFSGIKASLAYVKGLLFDSKDIELVCVNSLYGYVECPDKDLIIQYGRKGSLYMLESALNNVSLIDNEKFLEIIRTNNKNVYITDSLFNKYREEILMPEDNICVREFSFTNLYNMSKKYGRKVLKEDIERITPLYVLPSL
ncbi:MAG: hypothetical protein KAH32_04030 [Chlamydiia bacterium]|nr:hypothetical protein [Chlamydiia bacterium]